MISRSCCQCVRNVILKWTPPLNDLNKGRIEKAKNLIKAGVFLLVCKDIWTPLNLTLKYLVKQLSPSLTSTAGVYDNF